MGSLQQQSMSEKSINRYKNKIDVKRISHYFQQIKKMFSKQRILASHKLDKSQYKPSSSFDIPRHKVFRRYADLTLKQVKQKTIQQHTIQVGKKQSKQKSFSVKKINMQIGIRSKKNPNKFLTRPRILRRHSKSRQLINYSPLKQGKSLLVFSKPHEQLSPFANRIQRFQTEVLHKNFGIKKQSECEPVEVQQIDQPQHFDKTVIKCKLKAKTTILKRDLFKNRIQHQKKSEHILEDIKKIFQSQPFGKNTPGGTLGPWGGQYENPQF